MNITDVARNVSLPSLVPSVRGMLQRKCTCGSHINMGGQCDKCAAKKGVLQRKLTIGASNDPLEQEADWVADQIMSTPLNSAINRTPPKIQRLTGQTSDGLNTAPPSVERVLASPGRPLESALRQDMEQRFGYDFAQVRVHTGSEAERSARDVDAQAYTLGQNIVFGKDRFQTNSAEERKLIAHELVHTVQQNQANSDSSGALLKCRIQRRWDTPRPGDCIDVPDSRWIRKVVVEQETPQSITLHWSDGTLETAGCSTGKGHCCVDTPDGVTCDRERSRTTGSNCTPISSGAEFPISDRRREHNTWQFWNTFVPSRGIALHEYPVVDGTPLSHGCVRLPLNTARHIFCGERQNQTMVEVRGFVRPRCDHDQLKEEWRSDISNSSLPGSDGEEYRGIVRDGYGRELSGTERAELLAGTSNLSFPPRCPSGRIGAPPTVEEKRALPIGSTTTSRGRRDPRTGEPTIVPGTVSPTEGQRILEVSGFESLIPRFIAALVGVRNIADARRVVQREGRNLWATATAKTQRRAGGDTDDRPLYWTRLEMTRALRGFQFRWPLTTADRDKLIERFEDASRGRDTVTFTGARKGTKRILLSGFDPFSLTDDPDRGNPSGAAVLALDGQTLTSGDINGRVEGTIFPVRFADFDAGRVESFFTPFITGTNRVDMVMTISQGVSVDFEVEEFAARRRTNAITATDNLGVRGDRSSPGTPGAARAPTTIEPPNVGAGPQFLQTTLPGAVRGSLRSAPLPGETEITEIPAGGVSPSHRASGGPTAGSTAIAGSGGNYLSNEIFYRTRLLRDSQGSTVPIGHLHTPMLEPPSTMSAADFAAARDGIVVRIRQILIDTLPSI